MTNTTYTITVPCKVPQQVIEDVITNALYAQWGWWGDCHKTDRYYAYTIEELDDDGSVLAVHDLTYIAIVNAIEKVLTGEVGIRPDLQKQIATAVTDDPDIDADAADCILQIAALGESRYG